MVALFLWIMQKVFSHLTSHHSGDHWKQTAEKILNDNYSSINIDADMNDVKDNTTALETLKIEEEDLEGKDFPSPETNKDLLEKDLQGKRVCDST